MLALKRHRPLVLALTIVALLLALTAGSIVAAPDKAQGKGSKKGRLAHVVGTVAADSDGKTVTVSPRNKKKAGTPVAFTIVTGTADGNTRFVGEGVTEGTTPTLKAGMRVNVVGRLSADGKTRVARVIVIQGPRDNDAATSPGGKGKNKAKAKNKD